MRSCFRKIGLTFSAAAVLFTALYLPLHHHKEDIQNSLHSAHCSVCHFSKQGKTGAAAGSVSGAPIALQETLVTFGLSKPDLPLCARYVSQRAPPAV